LNSHFTAVVDQALTREAAWRHRRLAGRLLCAALFALILWLSAARIKLSLANVISGVPNMVDFFGRMVPPEASYLEFLVAPTIETVQIRAAKLMRDPPIGWSQLSAHPPVSLNLPGTSSAALF
jgi:ABC-type phosphate/phosphonate transport system permease subunit